MGRLRVLPEKGEEVMRRVVIGSVVAGLAIAAAAGMASGTIKVKTSSITLDIGPEQHQQFATAKCKKGLRAISGGFNGPGFDSSGSEGPYQIPLTSQRDSKREWSSSAYDDGDEGEFINYVKCSDELPKLKAKTATETVANGERGTATAHCPKSGEAVSGGFVAGIDDVAGDSVVYVSESRRAGKQGWRVAGLGSIDPLDLTAVAYCAKHKVGLRTRSAGTESGVHSANLSAKAKCKQGERALSGGFSGTLEGAENGDFDVFTQPYESRPTGRRAWQASGEIYPDPGFTAEVKAFAYCLEKEKKG
jgi:hypothetical protein